MPTLLELIADGQLNKTDTIKKWNGLVLRIQVPPGGVRKGVDKKGNAWSQRMSYAYGEIQGTEGIDKEPVDCIVGDYLASTKIFVCKLPEAKSGEDKCLIGFLTKQQAKKAFIACYGGDASFLESIKSSNLRQFKKLLIARKGQSLLAMSGDDFDISYRLTALDPLPTGWNTKVENPGDVELSPDDKKFQIELARRQAGAPSYAEVAQVMRTWCVDNVYSCKEKK